MLTFLILKDWVTEPVVVKTVSNFNESTDKSTCASLLVITLSFLQEKMNRSMIEDKMVMALFMDPKSSYRFQIINSPKANLC